VRYDEGVGGLLQLLSYFERLHVGEGILDLSLGELELVLFALLGVDLLLDIILSLKLGLRFFSEPLVVQGLLRSQPLLGVVLQ